MTDTEGVHDMGITDGTETVLVTVRMPSWMREWLKDLSKEGDRTLSAQIVRELRLVKERQAEQASGEE